MAANPPKPTLSAARLTLAVKRARAEAGASAQLLLAEPIAIVGMGCRFPGGSTSPGEYWRLLSEGRSGIREIPAGRWPGARETLSPHLLLGGYLDDVDLFDPEFFGIAPREAHSIDPQQRLLLEVCWQALADAGIAPASLSGTDTSVFLAEYNSDYARMQLREGASIDSYTGIGTAHSVSAGRVSFLLNLRGPCMAVDTACSSSLATVHLACQSLRQRHCGIALAGGSSLKLLPDEVRAFAQWGMLSSDGRAKVFDASADGFVPGEGCGVIVLKRLSDALAQGDRIHAVIRGAAINHDGRSSVLTAPNGPAQEAVIRAALRDAQVEPADVSYVEAHGTGTSLGDPIEVEALDAVYGQPSEGRSACVLGAVKSNIGHLEASAGVAGLIKVVLSLENQQIPRNLNFTELNPQIHLTQTNRLRLAIEAHPWPRSAQPRFAAVSSFGIGGTNAHIVLEEAPALPRPAETATAQREREYCLPISAHTAESLEATAKAYIALLRRPNAYLGRVASAASLAHNHYSFRIAVSATSATEAADKLDARLAAKTFPVPIEENHGKLAFVFSGQGSLWQGMLPGLLDYFPEAEAVFSNCERIIAETAGWSLRAASEDPAMLHDTAKSQPLLFTLQIALLSVLKDWGIAPAAVAGHSVGEVAAAVAADALSLELGLQLVLRRGQRMAEKASEDREPGGMLAAEMSEADALAMLASIGEKAPIAELAAVNGPRSIVFSGRQSAIESLAADLAERGIGTRRLDVQYGFHSAEMEHARIALEADLRVASISPRRPSLALVSTVTGDLWQPADGAPAYWARGIRRPVQFRRAVDRLFDLGCRTFIEIGPRAVLLRSLMECASAKPSMGAVATAAAMRHGQSARATLMSAAAFLYEHGSDLQWQKIYPGPPVHEELPPYFWNKQRYWILDPPSARPSPIFSVSSNESLDGALSQREISSAFIEGHVLETQLTTRTLPWLTEHRWHGEPIFPFAAWLELARRAADSTGSSSAIRIRDFAVHRPLQIGDEAVIVQTLATTARELKLAAQIGAGWESFASGFWEHDESRLGPSDQTIDIEALKRQTTQIIAAEDIYAELEANGLTYGPAFRLLHSVHAGPGLALGEIHLSASEAATSGAAALHPALLDACLQTLQAALPAHLRGVPVLPASISSYRVFSTATEVYALAELSSSSASGAEADVTVVNPQGQCIAELRSLRVRIAASSQPKAPLWQLVWHEMPEPQPSTHPAESQLNWILLTLPGNRSNATLQARLLNEMASSLADRGEHIHNLDALSPVTHVPFSVLLAGSRKSVVAQLLEVVAAEQRHPGVIEHLCLITRGAISVHTEEDTDPDQTALLGLARTFRAEYPSIAVKLIDLPLSTVTITQEVSILTPWLQSRLHQDHVASEEAALRNGRLLSNRLQPSHLQSGSELPQPERILVIGQPGLLESLHEEAWTPPNPADDEVQIECRTHGLNFRDVLTALGTYAGTAAPMGGECAGVVVKAGKATSFALGDKVIAFAPQSLRSIVNVPASFVVHKPAEMSFAEGATIPVAFLTAHYSFSRLVNLAPGQTVLIHSAAGGLGQAAVQLARRAGARVFATAGNAERRAWLRSQGIEHVFDSRSTGFAEEVLRVTEGQGVDAILNALSGDKIAASFRALRHGGAFLEVGKRDIWTPEQVTHFRSDARYWAFDLGEVVQRDPSLAAQMLRELFCGFTDGSLTPLPHETYSISEAERAFRLMASGRHTGKLVLAQPSRPLAEQAWVEVLRDGTVLITGGTGALGIATARWLLAQGARSLVLVSRTGLTRNPSESLQQLQTECHAKGAQLQIEQADVADQEQLGEVLASLRSSNYSPLRVIFHAAGETADRLLADHDTASFTKAMQTKTEGASLLKELTASDDLLITVYYSSLAALLGSAGQGSYAAANAFLDGLAEHRTARGLRTLSVSWGAWADGGMVDQLSISAAARLTRQGVRPMLPAAALTSLRSAILSGQSNITIATVDWNAYRDQFPQASAAQSFFAEFLRQSSRDATDGSTAAQAAITASSAPAIGAAEIDAIRNAVRSERVPRMETFARESARKVLGLSAGRPIPADTPLQELGLDSLMALELRNVLVQALGRPLSATLLFDYPSVRTLSQYLIGMIVPEGESQSVVTDRTFNAQDADRTNTSRELAEMTDDEVEELLLAELERKASA